MTSRVALALDVYGTLVDPIGIRQHLKQLLLDEATRVAALWRQTQLEYTFRLTAMGQYLDFAWVTRRALEFALAATGQSLDETGRAALMAAYDDLECFADVHAGLRQLQTAGCGLAVFSNGTPPMLDAVLDRSGLRPYFGMVISVDEVRTYKPSPRVYRHAARRLGLPPDAVYLVSSNPFDVVGAQAAGLRAAWINRSRAVFDTLAPPPDVVVTALTELPGRLAETTHNPIDEVSSPQRRREGRRERREKREPK
ncbi:MAG: haloacid dehalogenase type II [Chloroflexi bacterium]|nr:haloacid dehalogenase type II [Chloroflexota bacterium]